MTKEEPIKVETMMRLTNVAPKIVPFEDIHVTGVHEGKGLKANSEDS